MKMPRSLPETDLARVALLPDEQKRIVLRGVRSFVPPHSLSPLRKVASALYAARPSLLELPKCTFSEIEAAIRRYCGTNLHWAEPNLSLAKLLFDYNEERQIKAVEWEFPIIPVGYGAKIKFWHDFYSIQDDVPVLSFLDPRLTDGLGLFGRTFVFSAMHHNVAIGDFKGAKLEIVRFPLNKYTGKREVEIFTFDERDVVEESVLNGAIDRTYKIWNEILAERIERARRERKTGTDDDGFGF
ncbi:MAG: hypothetical protein Q8M24_03360 [Pseudolabrys sp.]|nr:hypothetical protein [Pseudolabrys sp.]MDP2294484.1 hypothetical protein [Pseudolabrys sp.]